MWPGPKLIYKSSQIYVNENAVDLSTCKDITIMLILIFFHFQIDKRYQTITEHFPMLNVRVVLSSLTICSVSGECNAVFKICHANFI